MISFLFVSLYEYLIQSPYMRLEQVIVKGVDEQMKDKILQVSKLSPDSSLLALNLNELKGRIERLPWIRAAYLEKYFPRTLIIKAEKEKPWAIIATENLYYMNREGVVFTKVDQSGTLDYPIITGISLNDADRGSRLSWAVHIFKALEAQKRPWSLEDLSEIHFNREGLVDLYFSSLPVVKVKESEVAKRIEDLKEMINHLRDTGRIHMVRGINMNYQEGAVVSYKNR
jgi:cell division protein FtsQ